MGSVFFEYHNLFIFDDLYPAEVIVFAFQVLLNLEINTEEVHAMATSIASRARRICIVTDQQQRFLHVLHAPHVRVSLR